MEEVVEERKQVGVHKLLPGYPERYAAFEWAEKVGLADTADVIRLGGCYDQVFRAAIGELGSPERLVSVLVTIGDPKWAYHLAVSRAFSLPSNCISNLVLLVIRSKNSLWASHFLEEVDRLSQDDENRLREMQ